MTFNPYQLSRAIYDRSIQKNLPIICFFYDSLCDSCKSFSKAVLSHPILQELLENDFIPVFLEVNCFPELWLRLIGDSDSYYHQVCSIDGIIFGNCKDSNTELILRNIVYYHENIASIQIEDKYGKKQYKPLIMDSQNKFHQKIERISEITLSSLLKNYDRMYGGWYNGHNPIKKHFPSSLEYLLLLYQRTRDNPLLQMIVQTLDSSYSGLYDPDAGGFYEYSVSRDWTTIGSYQKVLQTNVSVAKIYLHMFQISKDYRFRDILKESLEFINDQFWDESECLFTHSILTNDSEFIKNDYFITDSNCQVLLLFLDSNLSLEEQRYIPKVQKVIKRIEEGKTKYGIPHTLNEPKPDQFLLRDQAAFLQLLLNVYSLSGDISYLHKAEKMLEIIMSFYFDRQMNLFQDRLIRENDFGPFKQNIYSIQDNAVMINNLVTHSHFLNNPTYKEIAMRCVTSYYQNFGISRDSPFPSEFVIAAQRIIESPIELLIIGHLEEETDLIDRMLLEMKRIYDPFKIIQILDPIRDKALIEKKLSSIRIFKKPTCYVKVGDTISPPTFFPKEIALLLDTLLEAIKYTFE